MKDKDATFAILAGGLSSRMGQDKALLPIQGEPLIQRVVNQGKAISDNFLVITNRPEAYQFLQVPLVRDILSIKGPLVGLYTALCVSKSAFLILVGCDMPFINLAMLSFQLGVLEHEDFDVVIPKHANGLEPLHAVYRRETCLYPLKFALDEGERSLLGWLNRVRVREIPENTLLSFDPDLRAFMNLNTPQDYQEAGRFSLCEKGETDIFPLPWLQIEHPRENSGTKRLVLRKKGYDGRPLVTSNVSYVAAGFGSNERFHTSDGQPLHKSLCRGWTGQGGAQVGEYHEHAAIGRPGGKW